MHCIIQADRALSGDRLDLFKLKDLTFEAPDLDTFKGLALAMKAARAGGNIPDSLQCCKRESSGTVFE